MKPYVFYLTTEEIERDHAPDAAWKRPDGTLDHPYYDSDGEPMPGWYAEVGMPGCLPEGIFGPHETAVEAWMDATDDGSTVWPTEYSTIDGKPYTRHALIVPDQYDDRVPYFVELDQATIKGIGIMLDWGHSFIDCAPPRYHCVDVHGWDPETAPTIEESAYVDMAWHGCATGAWMPAVTYVQARSILQYADRLDDYFEAVGIEHSFVVATERDGGADSLDGLACRVACLLVESIAQSIDLEADCARHRMEDRS